VYNIRVYRGADCGSDHHLLKMEYSWPWIKQMSENIKQIQPRIDEVQEEKLNVKLLQDESIRTLCVQRMNKIVDESYTGTSEEIYTYIITYVKRIAHEVLGTKKIKIKK
jgi:hypothetical protein